MIDSLDWKDIVDDRVDAPPQVIGKVNPHKVMGRFNRRGHVVGKQWLTWEDYNMLKGTFLVNRIYLLTEKRDEVRKASRFYLVKF